ncbi:hypothetical protein G6F22_021244 [Rhizopus arrhizus]|nr:hypothetical protein G6F22_021244 [Rhizopus arrhizus]KAG1379020.1 hypothetical protein G6F59_018069 [Rhizopus arrhizus]
MSQPDAGLGLGLADGQQANAGGITPYPTARRRDARMHCRQVMAEILDRLRFGPAVVQVVQRLRLGNIGGLFSVHGLSLGDTTLS